MPLVLHGCGSINDILEMKVYEIKEANVMINDDDFRKSFMLLHGLEPK